jgi:phosphohistidine phosphatase
MGHEGHPAYPCDPIQRADAFARCASPAILLARELFPDLILTSPALRARQTIEIICRKSGFRGDVLQVDDLFTADQSCLLQIISTLPEPLQRVMIVAHTPGLKQLLNILSGWDKSFPLNALAYLVIPIHHWREVLELETEAVLVELWSPSQPDSSYFMGFYEVG